MGGYSEKTKSTQSIIINITIKKQREELDYLNTSKKRKVFLPDVYSSVREYGSSLG